MNIRTQMTIAKSVLEKLETFDPTCILAGGAPRDWHFDKLATDLDFYVYFRPDFDSQRWRYENMLQNLGLDAHLKGRAEFPENYKRNPYLLCVYECVYNGQIIQIMFMKEKTFSCVVDMFPFGICQAWWKGKDIHVSKYFDESVNHKILRVLNDLYSDEDGYIQKIRDKFPDYLFVGRQ